jgi:hypothetical protein
MVRILDEIRSAGFFVKGVLALEPAVLHHFEPLGVHLLVLGGRVPRNAGHVARLAGRAFQRNDYPVTFGLGHLSFSLHRSFKRGSNIDEKVPVVKNFQAFSGTCVDF